MDNCPNYLDYDGDFYNPNGTEEQPFKEVDRGLYLADEHIDYSELNKD